MFLSRDQNCQISHPGILLYLKYTSLETEEFINVVCAQLSADLEILPSYRYKAHQCAVEKVFEIADAEVRIVEDSSIKTCYV